MPTAMSAYLGCYLEPVCTRQNQEEANLFNSIFLGDTMVGTTYNGLQLLGKSVFNHEICIRMAAAKKLAFAAVLDAGFLCLGGLNSSRYETKGSCDNWCYGGTTTACSGSCICPEDGCPGTIWWTGELG